MQLGGPLLLQLQLQALRRGQQGLHLGQFQLRDRADLVAAGEDALRLLPGFHRTPCPRQAFIQFAQADVAVGYLRHQGQFGRQVARFGGQPLLQCRLLEVAHPPPQVQLPAAQAHFGAVLGTHGRHAGGVEVAGYPCPRTLCGQAQVRELVGALDPERRACLVAAQGGDAQVAVVGQGGLHQLLQQRIGEVAAPGRQRRRRRGRRDRGRPVRRHRRRGCLVGRGHRSAAGQQCGQYAGGQAGQAGRREATRFHGDGRRAGEGERGQGSHRANAGALIRIN